MEGRMKIAITMGDPAGIGAEIIVKALSRVEVYRKCMPVVLGDKEALLDALSFCGLPLELREIKNTDELTGKFGTIEYIDFKQLKKMDGSIKRIAPHAEGHPLIMLLKR